MTDASMSDAGASDAGTRAASDASAMEPTQVLRDLRAVGEDARRCVRIELDGTGEVVDVQVTSVAQDGGRGALETSIREAVVAVNAALQAERARHATAIRTAAVEQVGDLTTAFAGISAQATAQLDTALAKIAAAAERVGR